MGVIYARSRIRRGLRGKTSVTIAMSSLTRSGWPLQYGVTHRPLLNFSGNFGDHFQEPIEFHCDELNAVSRTWIQFN